MSKNKYEWGELKMSWYALYTPGGKEDVVKQLLEEKIDNFSFVIFRRKLRERKEGKWHMVERKLFPGYIICEGDMTEENWHKINNVEVNARVLRNDDTFLTLTSQEIDVLTTLDKESSGLMDMSEGFYEGDQIVINSGPLKGQEARIASVNKRKGRAKVKLSFCGSERIVELGIRLVEKV